MAKPLGGVSCVVVGDPPQPGGLGAKLVAGDREQPGSEVRAGGVFVQPRVGGDEARLRDVVDIDAGWGMGGQPDPQWPLELPHDAGERLHITRADAPEGIVDHGGVIVAGRHRVHHKMMAGPPKRFLKKPVFSGVTAGLLVP